MNFDRHFYLYAKGHYQWSGSIDVDLKALVAKRCALEPGHVAIRDIARILARLAQAHIDFTKNDSLFDFLSSSVTGYYVPGTDDASKLWMDVCMACLFVLAQVEITAMPFPLGNADPNILPVATCQK